MTNECFKKHFLLNRGIVLYEEQSRVTFAWWVEVTK